MQNFKVSYPNLDLWWIFKNEKHRFLAENARSRTFDPTFLENGVLDFEIDGLYPH